MKRILESNGSYRWDFSEEKEDPKVEALKINDIETKVIKKKDKKEKSEIKPIEEAIKEIEEQ